MTSRSEKTLRQIRQILQTTDDYERNERNLSQNSPFSCYLTPRANLYNQYPYRIPLGRKSPRKTTKKKKTQKSINDFTSGPFLFNNSNPLYSQLSNSAKKAFLPYSNSRLNTYSRDLSNSKINPISNLQTQSVQTSLALILDQSDSSDDPITAKQNEILSFIKIGENLLLKRFFNRWRQRWFFQTAYSAHKLIQSTGIATLRRQAKKSLQSQDSRLKDQQEKVYSQSQKVTTNDQDYHNDRKNDHHHLASLSKKNSHSQAANKRFTQTDIVHKNGYFDRNDNNPSIDQAEDYEYSEIDDREKTGKNNRHVHKNLHAKRDEEEGSNENNNYEYDYEYVEDYCEDDEININSISDISGIDTTTSEDNKKGRRARRKIKRRYKSVTQADSNRSKPHKKLSKTGPIQKESEFNVHSKMNKSVDQNSKNLYFDSFKNDDDYNDSGYIINSKNSTNDRDFINSQNNRHSRQNSPLKSSYKASKEVSRNQDLLDYSSNSILDDRNLSKQRIQNNQQKQQQKAKISSSTQHRNNSPSKTNEASRHHKSSSRRNSPTKSSKKKEEDIKINQNYLDYSSASLIDNQSLLRQQQQSRTRSSINQRNSSYLVDANENSHFNSSLRNNSPNRSTRMNDLLQEDDQLFSDDSLGTLTVPTNFRTKSSIKKDDMKAKKDETNQNHSRNQTSSINNNNNSNINSSINNNNNNNSSRRNSLNRSKINDSLDANQNFSDYSNDLFVDTKNQSKQQQLRFDASGQRNSSLNKSEGNQDPNYSRHFTTQNISTNTSFTNGNNSGNNQSGSMKVNVTKGHFDYLNESIIDIQNQSIQQRKSTSTQKNLSSVEPDEKHENRSRNNSPSRSKSTANEKQTNRENYSDYSNSSAAADKHERSVPNQGNKRKTKMLINVNVNDQPKRKNSPKRNLNLNNSYEYQNYSDYSMSYANSEQEVNKKQNSRRRKYSENVSRTKEYTFAGDSKTFSPIRSPKNFDDVVSQIIPDLDEFIEKYSTKPQNWSLDDESDAEFKSLIERSRFYNSKYSTLSTADGGNENSRRVSLSFNDLIPVNTSLTPNQNISSLNKKIDTTLPELHEFDDEMDDENGSPPLYFNK